MEGLFLAGSPNGSKGRTFKAVFEFPPSKKRPKTAKIRQPRPYRNPIILAREWQKALKSGEYSSQADLARKLGISRARVNQVLKLLKLAPKVLDMIEALGDPLPMPIVTERILRPLAALPQEKQEPMLRKML